LKLIKTTTSKLELIMKWNPMPIREFGKNHPVILFIGVTYVWTWSFWIPANSDGLPPGMKPALTFLGAFGPALAGSLILRLRTSVYDSRPRHWGGFLVGAALAATAIALLYFDIAGINRLAPKPDLIFGSDAPWHVHGLMAAVVVISAFVFSNVQSRSATVRSFYKGLIPSRRALLLAIPVLMFLPVVLVSSNFLADIAGISYEAPEYSKQSIGLWLPLMFVKLITVAMLTGGNEEHGWRGVLLPMLQKHRSPLVATLFIAFVWELWHFPLILDGLYGDQHIALIMTARVVAILPIALIMTAIYNVSRGSIFLCILMHACFNTQLKLFVGTELMALFVFVIVIASVLITRMWRRSSGYIPVR